MHRFNTKDIQWPKWMNYFLTQRQTRAKPCVSTAHFANAYIVFSKRLHFISKCNKKLNWILKSTPLKTFFSAGGGRFMTTIHILISYSLSLLDAMNAGCEDTSAEDCQAWIRHAKRFFPRRLAQENIRCDVENAWPNAGDRLDWDDLLFVV